MSIFEKEMKPVDITPQKSTASNELQESTKFGNTLILLAILRHVSYKTWLESVNFVSDSVKTLLSNEVTLFI